MRLYFPMLHICLLCHNVEKKGAVLALELGCTYLTILCFTIMLFFLGWLESTWAVPCYCKLPALHGSLLTINRHNIMYLVARIQSMPVFT